MRNELILVLLPQISHANTVVLNYCKEMPAFEGKSSVVVSNPSTIVSDNSRYMQIAPEPCQKYKTFPDLSDWKAQKMLQILKDTAYSRSSVTWFENLWMKLSMTTIKALLDIIDSNIPIIYNLNVSTRTPRAIVPFRSPCLRRCTVYNHLRFDYNK